MGATTERPPSILGPRRAALARSSVGPTVHRPPPPQPWDGWPEGWGTSWGVDTDVWLTRVSTVMTCVDLNSRQVGSFPVYGVTDPGGERFRLPAWSTYPEPLQYSSWDEFTRQAINSLQLYGETFLYATARDFEGRPARFVVLNPNSVSVDVIDGVKEYRLGGEPVDPDDILHVPYQTLAGRVRGIGPIEWACRSLVSATALERYAADIAQSGVWAVLQHPAQLDAQQAADAKATWMANRTANPSEPAVISGGWTFDVLSLSPRDMALLDLRVFDEQRIAAAFGIPPFLVGLPQSSGLTYANATSLLDYHWRATLRPMSRMFARALSAWTLPRGKTVEFNADFYTRPDLETRARSYETLHRIEDESGRVIDAETIRHVERLAVVDPNEGAAPL